jgi:hypothetical protein
MTEYECALSGEVAEKADLVVDEDDDLPVGWTRITIERRTINPRWVYVQNVKAALVEAALMQVPEEAREQMYPLMAMQIEAQFAALEAQTEQYEIVPEVVFVAPVESDEQLATEYNEIRAKFGLDAVGVEPELDAEEGEE